VTAVRVAFVDTYVLRNAGAGAGAGEGAGEALEVLVLRRGPAGRCPGSWETVHGTIETGESPVQASLRELREETGFVPARLYNVSRVEAFYQHRSDEIALIPVFAAFVAARETPRLSHEHDQAAWLTPAAAAARFSWPRERRALEDIVALFVKGDGGLLDDVLRVC
jgi:dATP pyrophosphohydrolase